ncbi:MAG: hypothetical protein JST23_10495 [Bacteroidetes bacterium]|nr:hypothetical protein [Bacteroidota bacterium]
MARSHHRKKHKSHVRNFKQEKEGIGLLEAKKSRSSGKVVFALGGAVAAFVISYFATDSNLWMAVITLIGAGLGYLLGKQIDNMKNV